MSMLDLLVKLFWGKEKFFEKREKIGK